jgi:hypothetical protein
LFEHIDVDINKAGAAATIPVRAALVASRSHPRWGMHLYSVDSAHTKIFGHSDLQYAPAIGILEQVLRLRRNTTTRSPTHLNCIIQPNSCDCCYHAVLSAMSISDYIISEDDYA